MKLSAASVEFARKHIQQFSDSVFLVKPFEFDAMWANWTEVSTYLTDKEIRSFNIESPGTFTIPKPKGGYRVVHQLDPLNSMIYTALAYEVAEAVEKHRAPVEQGVACSYRIKTDSKGNFFEKGTRNGYETFYIRSLQLSREYSHVLITDIADFYNQIYLHRLQNAIESCDDNLEELSRDIEWFLSTLNTGPSKGIPVGPSASIVMSEALLIDIDEFIIGKDMEYVRYVDDFRIFSNSSLELKLVLAELTHYLYSAHRLTLSSSKTEIIESQRFVDEYVLDPETKEKRAIHKELELLDIDVNSHYPDLEPLDSFELLPNDSKIRVQAKALNNLITEIVKQPYLDLGLARHIFRRARILRSRAILDQTLNNFDFFAPVIRDVMLYIDRITTSKVIDHYLPKFEQLLQRSTSIFIPVVRYWLEYYIGRYPPLYQRSSAARSFMSNSKSIRNLALCAKANKQIAWVRAHKDLTSNYGPWDKRAILLSPSGRVKTLAFRRRLQ